MGSALLGGLLDGGWDADELAVAEVDPERRRELEQLFPKVRIVPSPAWAVAEADVVVVAVKPGDVAPSLQGAESSLRIDALVLS
ncbi:MAG: pyrroline-5-carboxylate reductase, partial [Actinomycetota bacterium]|nr:pyrroline-5-carboxylate reductase [Actinomycetota bacterium]